MPAPTYCLNENLGLILRAKRQKTFDFVRNKKLIYIVMALVAVWLPARAQDDNILRQFSMSVGIGTTGFTADVGTMVTDFIGVRGGIDIMPKFKYSTDLSLALVNQTVNLDIPDVPDYKVEVQGTLHNTTGHALLDFYPLTDRVFHVTVGAFIAGSTKTVDITTEENELLKKVADLNARRGQYADIPIGYGQVAAKMGEYNIMPADDGTANAYIKVKKLRPYLGLGYGRAVPSESRVSYQIDAGVQFTGKASVFNGVNGEEITADGVRGEDGGYLKAISRISFYPVISIRLVGRLF